MGTRSTTKIYDNGDLLLSLYKQWDGYTEDWGNELKKFIKSGKFVRGYTPSKETQFNGMGCFALQLIAKFKDGIGDLYATTEQDEQAYNYKIEYFDKKDKQGNLKPFKIVISCLGEKKFREVIKL